MVSVVVKKEDKEYNYDTDDETRSFLCKVESTPVEDGISVSPTETIALSSPSARLILSQQSYTLIFLISTNKSRTGSICRV